MKVLHCSSILTTKSWARLPPSILELGLRAVGAVETDQPNIKAEGSLAALPER